MGPQISGDSGDSGDSGRPLAVVTGASRGIGLELARQFAAHGFDLVIRSRGVGIHRVAEELRRTGAEVEAVEVDLATGDGVEQCYTAIVGCGRPVDVAALNAGVAQGGAFAETALDDELNVIAVNVTSTVHLAKRLLPDMVDRNSGRLLITSSIAATSPFLAVYNASKSFLQSFAEALQNELKDSAVTVTSLMPGPSETEIFHRAGMDDTRVGRADKDDPAEVARQAFVALMNGDPRVVASSLKTKATKAVNKVLPDKVKAAAYRLATEPGSGQ